jgi:thiamine-monophosphate kinase
MSLNEFSLIKQFFTRQAQQPSVIKSVGDDCAILSVPNNQQLVLSMDTLVAGRHFPESATPYQIATRALCTSVSDLAAMGATPLWFTLGLTLPSSDELWLAQFSEGLFAAAAPFGMDLIGGDTTKGPLAITIQAHGAVDKDCALQRDTAQESDRVFVGGYMGDGAAALALLQKKITASAELTAYLVSRFYSPTPQVALGQAIAPFAHAAIDISDGLLADAQHIADASRVSLIIDVDRLPLHPLLNDCLQKGILGYERDTLLNWALTGGDDYQLLFTVSESQLAAVNALIDNQLIHATEIGTVVAASDGVQCAVQYDVQCTMNGAPYALSTRHRGYQHFTA